MPHKTNVPRKPDRPVVYQIRIKGHLDSRWSDWLEQMDITQAANGETILTGPIVDQAALHGVITKVRDLGLPLISIEQVEPAPNSNHRKDSI